MSTFKQQIHLHFSKLLDEKIQSLQRVLDDLKESGANETKSTAGDKHETALAMLQIEQANKRSQMQQLVEQKSVLNKIDPSIKTVEAVVGSLIETPDTYYFISIALGKSIVDGKQVIALSAQSPLGKQLLGHTTGESISFNGKTITIIDLL